MKSAHGMYRWQNGCYYNTQTRCEAFVVYYLIHFDGSLFVATALFVMKRAVVLFMKDLKGARAQADFRGAGRGGLLRFVGRLETHKVNEQRETCKVAQREDF